MKPGSNSWLTLSFKPDCCALGVFKGQSGNGFYYSANNFVAVEHGVTHIDAPIHFSENSQTVNQTPLENLMVFAKTDVSAKALHNLYPL